MKLNFNVLNLSFLLLNVYKVVHVKYNTNCFNYCKNYIGDSGKFFFGLLNFFWDKLCSAALQRDDTSNIKIIFDKYFK